MNDNKPQTTVRETPDKQLPALMDGDTVLLPAATLPLPLGGKSTNPGRDGEDDWADYAAEILIPRWAVECIRENLVWGQELVEGDVAHVGDDEWERLDNGESLKERIDTIIGSPGEIDKWKRIVGWGIDVVRHLDLDKAHKWHGGLVELLALGEEKYLPGTLLRVAFTKRNGSYIAAAYWDSWTREGWTLVEQFSRRPEAMAASSRKRTEQLVTEGEAYWDEKAYTFPGSHSLIPLGRRWRLTHVTQMCKCLTELLAPSAERELSGEIIWLLFGANRAFFHSCEKKEADRLQSGLKIQELQSRLKSQQADAQAWAASLEAEKYRAQGREDELRQALQREAQERKRAEENWREAEKIASVNAALAEEREKELEEAEQKGREQAERAAITEGERDTWRAVANGKIGVAVHAASAAHAAAVKGQVAAEDARDAAVGTGKDARAAVRAALAAKDAARGNKRESIYYPDLITTFKEWEQEAAAKAIGKKHAEPKEVLRYAREDVGRKIGAMKEKKFLEMYGKWVDWKKPDADAFEKMWHELT